MKKILFFILVFSFYGLYGCTNITTATSNLPVTSITSSTTTTNITSVTTNTVTNTTSQIEYIELDSVVLVNDSITTNDDFLEYIQFSILNSDSCVVNSTYNLSITGNQIIEINCNDENYRISLHVIESIFLNVELQQDTYEIGSSASDIEDNVIVTNSPYVNMSINVDTSLVDFSTPGTYEIYAKVFNEDYLLDIYSYEILIKNKAIPSIVGDIHNFYLPLNSEPVDFLEGISFTDSDGVISESKVTSDVDYTRKGVYLLTYFAKDNDGNEVYEYANVVIGDLGYQPEFNFELLLSEEEILTLTEYKKLLSMFHRSSSFSYEHLSKSDNIIKPQFFELAMGRKLRQDELDLIQAYIGLLQSRDSFIFEKLLVNDYDVNIDIQIEAFFNLVWSIYSTSIDSARLGNLYQINDDFNLDSIYNWILYMQEDTYEYALHRKLTETEKSSINLYKLLYFHDDSLRLIQSVVLYGYEPSINLLYEEDALNLLYEYYASLGGNILYSTDLDSNLELWEKELVYAMREYKIYISYVYYLDSNSFDNDLTYVDYVIFYHLCQDAYKESRNDNLFPENWYLNFVQLNYIIHKREYTEEELVVVNKSFEFLFNKMPDYYGTIPTNNGLDQDKMSIYNNLLKEYILIFGDNTLPEFYLVSSESMIEKALNRELLLTEIDAINYVRTEIGGYTSLYDKIQMFFNDYVTSKYELLDKYFLVFQIYDAINNPNESHLELIKYFVENNFILDNRVLDQLYLELPEFTSVVFGNVQLNPELESKIFELYSIDWNELYLSRGENLLVEESIYNYYFGSQNSNDLEIIHNSGVEMQNINNGINMMMSADEVTYDGLPEMYDDFKIAYSNILAFVVKQKIIYSLEQRVFDYSNSILTNDNYLNAVIEFVIENDLDIEYFEPSNSWNNLEISDEVKEYLSVYLNVSSTTFDFERMNNFSNIQSLNQDVNEADLLSVLTLLRNNEINLFTRIDSVKVEDLIGIEELTYSQYDLLKKLVDVMYIIPISMRYEDIFAEFDSGLSNALLKIFADEPDINSYYLSDIFSVYKKYNGTDLSNEEDLIIQEYLRYLASKLLDVHVISPKLYDIYSRDEFVNLIILLLEQGIDRFDQLFYEIIPQDNLNISENQYFMYFVLCFNNSNELLLNFINYISELDELKPMQDTLFKIIRLYPNGPVNINNLLRELNTEMTPELEELLNFYFQEYSYNAYIDIVEGNYFTYFNDYISIDDKVKIKEYFLKIGMLNTVYIFKASIPEIIEMNKLYTLSEDDITGLNYILIYRIYKEVDSSKYNQIPVADFYMYNITEIMITDDMYQTFLHAIHLLISSEVSDDYTIFDNITIDDPLTLTLEQQEIINNLSTLNEYLFTNFSAIKNAVEADSYPLLTIQD